MVVIHKDFSSVLINYQYCTSSINMISLCHNETWSSFTHVSSMVPTRLCISKILSKVSIKVIEMKVSSSLLVSQPKDLYSLQDPSLCSLVICVSKTLQEPSASLWIIISWYQLKIKSSSYLQQCLPIFWNYLSESSIYSRSIN